MLRDKNCVPTGTSNAVNVDVTKIVKYVCVAGVLIVAVIFVTNCINKLFISNN